MNIYTADKLKEAPTTGGVYVIYMTHNPKKGYIGSTSNFRSRFQQHLSELKSKKHHNFHLRRLWKHYKGDFRWGILEHVSDPAYSREREQVYIDFYPKGSLYNLDAEVKKHRSD